MNANEWNCVGRRNEMRELENRKKKKKMEKGIEYRKPAEGSCPEKRGQAKIKE